MSLHIEFRPKTLDEFIGNDATIQSLEAILNREEGKPHVFLFSGPTGCGKTTLGRIVADRLGCKGIDFQELNTSDQRGIDTARQIMSRMRYKSMEGGVRVYLLDECFAKGTLIKTNNGSVPIEQIKKGDAIYNLQGLTKVKRVFKNKINLSRVVCLMFNNGKTITCSKEHLFLTNNGWKKAIGLSKKDLILKFDHSIMDCKEEQNDFKNMPLLQSRISNNKQKTKILFKFMQWSSAKKNIEFALRILWRIFYSKKNGKDDKKILFPFLRRKMECSPSRIQENNGFKKVQGKLYKSTKEMASRKSYQSTEKSQKFFRKNEKKQSSKNTWSNRKGQSYEKIKRDIAYFCRNSWRKWTINRTTNTPSLCFGVASGNSYFSWQEANQLSNKLQSGHRQQRIENSDRSGRPWTSIEKEYIERQKERSKIKSIRVESIEIYKQGNNDRSFESIISDTERDQGFIEFYDLEIEGHPSYFANDILVHNCHMGTTPFWNSLLKALEDTPDHVYFILCTTEPEKLPKTILNRCSMFKVEKLSESNLLILLDWVMDGFQETVEEDILKEIAKAAEGSPRKALVILDQIIDLDPADMKAAIAETSVDEKQIIDLCRAIIDRKKWPEITKILKGIKDDPEKVRWAMLGYFNSVLLNGTERAALVIDCFKEPFYNSGKAGLSLACYFAIDDGK